MPTVEDVGIGAPFFKVMPGGIVSYLVFGGYVFGWNLFFQRPLKALNPKRNIPKTITLEFATKQFSLESLKLNEITYFSQKRGKNGKGPDPSKSYSQ
jgi:hypothetical protein